MLVAWEAAPSLTLFRVIRLNAQLLFVISLTLAVYFVERYLLRHQIEDQNLTGSILWGGGILLFGKGVVIAIKEWFLWFPQMPSVLCISFTFGLECYILTRF